MLERGHFRVAESPVFIAGELRVVVGVGHPAMLECRASGDEPLALSWQRGNATWLQDSPRWVETFYARLDSKTFRLKWALDYKAFRHVETFFVQGRNLVPSRPAIG